MIELNNQEIDLMKRALEDYANNLLHEDYEKFESIFNSINNKLEGMAELNLEGDENAN